MNDINTLNDAKENRPGSRLGAIARLRDHHQPSKSAVLLGTAVLVGLGTAIGLLGFHWLLSALHELSFSYLPTFFTGRMNTLYFLFLPVLGGLLVGPLIYFVAPSAKGHGVPEIIEAVALRGGAYSPSANPHKRGQFCYHAGHGRLGRVRRANCHDGLRIRLSGGAKNASF